jgi:hypothetical protein
MPGRHFTLGGISETNQALASSRQTTKNATDLLFFRVLGDPATWDAAPGNRRHWRPKEKVPVTRGHHDQF